MMSANTFSKAGERSAWNLKRILPTDTASTLKPGRLFPLSPGVVESYLF
jgi:hypothetical protein